MIWTKYLMIPYKDLGRDFNGCDCYGLVYLLMRDISKVTLPIYSGYQSDDAPKMGEFINTEADHDLIWQKVTTPQAGDLVVFKLNGIPQHVGYMLNRFDYLEMTRDAGVTTGRVTDSSSRHLIAFYCRYMGIKE
jgi:cell wall-associated NlpC family hydrolase